VSAGNVVAARTGGIEEGAEVTTLCEDVLMVLLSLLMVEINQGKPFDFVDERLVEAVLEGRMEEILGLCWEVGSSAVVRM
jgi:hypothetical protein